MAGKTFDGVGASGPNPTHPYDGVGSQSSLFVENGVPGQSNDQFQVNTGFSNNYPGGTVERWGRTFNALTARMAVSFDNASNVVPGTSLYAGGGVLQPFDLVSADGRPFGNGIFSIGGDGLPGSNYYLAITRATLVGAEQVGAAVPEPATWMLMIGGFGLTGGAMRRAKARSAMTAA